MKTTTKRELSLVCLLLLLLSAVITVGFIIADTVKDGLFSYKVITGALLGSLMAFINYLILCKTVDRVLEDFKNARGTREMSEDEEKAFVEKHTAVAQLKMAKSLGFRMILMIATLVLAFILKQFNVIATVIPLALQKTVIQITQTRLLSKNEGGDRT